VTNMRRHGASGRCPLGRHAHPDLVPAQLVWDQAIEFFLNGAYSDCARKTMEALDIDPSHANANGLLGQLYAHGEGVTKDTERATHYYFIGMRNGCAAAFVELGRIYHDEGQISKAKTLYMEGLRKREVQGGSINLGTVYEEQGKVSKAIRFYKLAYPLGEKRGAFPLGKLLKQQGRIRQAKKFLMKAHSSGQVFATFRLGLLYEEQWQCAHVRVRSCMDLCISAAALAQIRMDAYACACIRAQAGPESKEILASGTTAGT